MTRVLLVTGARSLADDPAAEFPIGNAWCVPTGGRTMPLARAVERAEGETMDQARDFFGSWSEAWQSWLVVAGAGGSVVLAAAKQIAAPDASGAAIIGVLDAAREAAFAEYPEGGSVPEILVRGSWWSLSWNAGGRSRVTLEPYEKGRWVVTVEIRETDDGRSVSDQTDGQCSWWIAPPTYWRWIALHAVPAA